MVSCKYMSVRAAKRQSLLRWISLAIILAGVTGYGTYVFIYSSAQNDATSNIIYMGDPTGKLIAANDSSYNADVISPVDVINKQFGVSVMVPNQYSNGTRPSPGHVMIGLQISGAITSVECPVNSNCRVGVVNVHKEQVTGANISSTSVCMSFGSSDYGKRLPTILFSMDPNSPEVMSDQLGTDGSPAEVTVLFDAKSKWYSGNCPASPQYNYYSTADTYAVGGNWGAIRGSGGTGGSAPASQSGSNGVSATGNGHQSQNTSSSTSSGAVATKQADTSGDVVSQGAQGAEEQEPVMQPSPFFDGKSYQPGSDSDTVADVATSKSRNSIVLLTVLVGAAVSLAVVIKIAFKRGGKR